MEGHNFVPTKLNNPLSENLNHPSKSPQHREQTESPIILLKNMNYHNLQEMKTEELQQLYIQLQKNQDPILQNARKSVERQLSIRIIYCITRDQLQKKNLQQLHSIKKEIQQLKDPRLGTRQKMVKILIKYQINQQKKDINLFYTILPSLNQFFHSCFPFTKKNKPNQQRIPQIEEQKQKILEQSTTIINFFDKSKNIIDKQK